MRGYPVGAYRGVHSLIWHSLPVSMLSVHCVTGLRVRMRVRGGVRGRLCVDELKNDGPAGEMSTKLFTKSGYRCWVRIRAGAGELLQLRPALTLTITLLGRRWLSSRKNSKTRMTKSCN